LRTDFRLCGRRVGHLVEFHLLNYGMFDLAREYEQAGMTAYCKLQEEEFASEKDGYEGVKHQRFVGTGYFDAVQQAITSGKASTTALEGSTEAAQFHAQHAAPVQEKQARVAADYRKKLQGLESRRARLRFSLAFFIGYDGDSKKQGTQRRWQRLSISGNS